MTPAGELADKLYRAMDDLERLQNELMEKQQVLSELMKARKS